MSFNLVSISILSLLDFAEIKYEIKQSGRDVRLKLIGHENQFYGFCSASIYDVLTVCLPKVILRKYSDTKRRVYHLNEFQLNWNFIGDVEVQKRFKPNKN